MDIKFNQFKDSPLAEFLLELKDFTKDYCLNILEYGMVQKGYQSKYVSRFDRQVKNFYNKGYFDISKENNKTFFKLTAKGCDFMELLKFSAGKLKWDKRWRILIFDIPEKEKGKRDALRRKLKELGLRQLQQSVWITPYPLPNSFSEFLAKLRVRPYLYSLTVEKINREKELKEFFNL